MSSVPADLAEALAESGDHLAFQLVKPVLCILGIGWTREEEINFAGVINPYVLSYEVQIELAVEYGFLVRRRRWFRRGVWIKPTKAALIRGLPSCKDLEHGLAPDLVHYDVSQPARFLYPLLPGQDPEVERWRHRNEQARQQLRQASRQFAKVVIDALENG